MQIEYYPPAVVHNGRPSCALVLDCGRRPRIPQIAVLLHVDWHDIHILEEFFRPLASVLKIFFTAFGMSEESNDNLTGCSGSIFLR